MSQKYPVRWTVEAANTYEETIFFIFEKWTIREVETFELLTERLLNSLSSNLKLCPELKILKVRKCVISSQTSLIYRVVDKCIELITFVDNRSEHPY